VLFNFLKNSEKKEKRELRAYLDIYIMVFPVISWDFLGVPVMSMFGNGGNCLNIQKIRLWK